VKVVTIIPSRLKSTRLHHKPLVDIGGKPMIIRVYEQAVKANIGDVFVATCDTEIENLLDSYGYKYISTKNNINTGTDRVFSAYKILAGNYDIIINLQGDMPFVNPNSLVSIYQSLEKNECDISTGATYITDKKSIHDPNTVKIILSENLYAIYFSRSPIELKKNYKHLGIYCFKQKALEKFISLPQSSLEKEKNLEQFRALENFMKIKVAIVDDPNISIDTKDDLLQCNEYMKLIN
jgi:3-deoxy-manno-octulosonate cytidylyltransferase (CMP-KDO synthetase)